MKTKLSDAIMRPLANSLVNRFAPNCQRIEIAGSLRRLMPVVGDIELIAIPTPALYQQLEEALANGKIRHVAPRRWGDKLRSFLFDTIGGYTIQVDLFLQPDPATWGVNMMIRTGSAEFSKRMVTPRSRGGWMPDCYRVKDARVWWFSSHVPTPEEQDVFFAWGMDYVAPSDRTPGYRPVLHEHPPIEIAQRALL